MFDIGFSELMVIAVVALIVIGPERLPRVARTLGHLLGRMQRYVNDVKADISREMELDELKRLQTTIQDATKSFEDSVHREVHAAESEIQKLAQEANPTAPAPSEAESRDASAPAVPAYVAAADDAVLPAPEPAPAAEPNRHAEVDLGSSQPPAGKRA